MIKLSSKKAKIYWEYLVAALTLAAIPEIILTIFRNFNPVVFAIGIILNFSLLVVVIYYISKADFYKKFEQSGYHGIVIPLAIIFFAILIAVVCFGSLTYFLSDSGYVSLMPVPPKNELGVFNEFYFWHFFDLVPGIKIRDPLQWKVPYTYSDKVMPWIIFAYRVGVVGIIIKQFYKWNKWRKSLTKK